MSDRLQRNGLRAMPEIDLNRCLAFYLNPILSNGPTTLPADGEQQACLQWVMLLDHETAIRLRAFRIRTLKSNPDDFSAKIRIRFELIYIPKAFPHSS